MTSGVDSKRLAEQSELTFESLEPWSDDSELGTSFAQSLAEFELSDLVLGRKQQDQLALNFAAAGRYSRKISLQVQDCFREGLLYPLSDDEETEKRILEIEQVVSQMTGMPACRLLQMDVVSILTEILMEKRLSKAGTEKDHLRVLVPATVAPQTRNSLRTRLRYAGIDLVVADYDHLDGTFGVAHLQQHVDQSIDALLLAWPNFFGCLENVAELLQYCRERNIPVIALAESASLSLLQPPFNDDGVKVDFVLASLQPFAMPCGFSCEAPGFVAATDDESLGKLDFITRRRHGYKHLRAISQGLSLLSLTALYETMNQANRNLKNLVDRLEQIAGVKRRFCGPFVNECVIQLEGVDMEQVMRILAGHNMIPGYILEHDYAELSDCLLVHCDASQGEQVQQRLASKLATVMKNLSTAGCPVKPRF